VLAHDGLISDTRTPIKILGVGEAPAGITIHAHAFSKSALDKLAAAGSTPQRLSWPDNAPLDELLPVPKRRRRDEGQAATGDSAAAEKAGAVEPATDN